MLVEVPAGRSARRGQGRRGGPRRAARLAGPAADSRSAALSAAADAVDAAKDELTSLMVREVGKPLAEAVGEHARAVPILRYQAQSALDPDGDTYPAAPPPTCARC